MNLLSCEQPDLYTLNQRFIDLYFLVPEWMVSPGAVGSAMAHPAYYLLCYSFAYSLFVSFAKAGGDEFGWFRLYQDMFKMIPIKILQLASLAVDLFLSTFRLLGQVAECIASIRDDVRDSLIAYNNPQPSPAPSDTSPGENNGDVEASDLPTYTVCSFSES